MVDVLWIVRNALVVTFVILPVSTAHAEQSSGLLESVRTQLAQTAAQKPTDPKAKELEKTKAQEKAKQQEKGKQKQKEGEAADDDEEDAEDGDGETPDAENILKKLGFGVALAFRWNVLEPDMVEEAIVDDLGIVRVNKRANTNAGIMLEMHYFPKRWKNDTFGVGPFVAAQPGTNEIVTAVGMGFMFGWRVTPEGKGFALGFGYAAQPQAKVLGKEFTENEAAPKNDKGEPIPIRLQTRDKGAVLIVSSFVF